MTVTLFQKPLFGLFPTSHPPLLRPRGRCRWQRRPWPLGVSSFLGEIQRKWDWMEFHDMSYDTLWIWYMIFTWYNQQVDRLWSDFAGFTPSRWQLFCGKNWGFKPGDGMGYMIFRETHLFLLDPFGEIDELMKKLINTEESWIHFFGIPLSKTSEGYGSNFSNLMSQNFGPGLHFSSKDLLQRNALGSWCVVV